MHVLEGLRRNENPGKSGAQIRAKYKFSKRRRVVEVVDRHPIFRIARADVQPQLLGRVKRQVAEGRPGVRVLMKIDNTGEPRKRNAKRRNIDVRRWVDVELEIGRAHV